MITKEWRKTPDIYPLHDVRVIDGDTIEARIVLPFGQSVQKRIRLKGWWADEPEGIWGASGLQAKALFEVWAKEKVLWLLAAGCREDKYGRVIGHLMHKSQIVSPLEVINHHQLTEAEHKERRDRNAALKKAKHVVDPNAWGNLG